MQKKIEHIVSFSGGKDSTAMLLHMIHLKYKIDKIVFCDTGLELPETYLYIDLIEATIKRKITRIKKGDWNKWFFGKVTRGKHKGKMRGFPLTYFPCWHNHEALYVPMRKICDGNTRYIGYHTMEKSAIRKNIIKKYLTGSTTAGHVYPLIDWGWSDQDCLNYLQTRKLLNPIYDRFSRTGCFLCPKQSKESLQALFDQYPLHWERLMMYNTVSKFNPAFDLVELEKQFQRESKAKKRKARHE